MGAFALAACGGDDDAAAPAEPAPVEAAPVSEPEPAPEPTAEPAPAAEPALPEPSPADSPPAEEADIIVTFEGEACRYEGPETVPTELVHVLYANKTAGKAGLTFAPLLEGFTLEDVIEFYGGHRAEVDPVAPEVPEFFDLEAFRTTPTSGVLSVGQEISKSESFKAAGYYVTCNPTDENGEWFGIFYIADDGLTSR